MDLSDTGDTSSDESASKKSLICSIDGCHKEFTKNRKLLNHIRLHQDKRPFACDVPNCNKKYTNSSHLRRHKTISHNHVTETIKCTVDGCDKELANKCSLKKHVVRCHNPQRVYPFTCGTCQQGFYRKRVLQQHIYLHTGELPFSCDECDIQFLTMASRNKHKKNHRKYTCECGEIYSRWNALRAHKKSCTRNLKCNICERIFSTKTNLKMHIKTHLDREDRNYFPCTYEDCDRFYLHNTNLTVHINSFHKKNPKAKIPCEYEGCNKLLSKMQNYNIHIRTHQETNKPKFPRKPRKDKGIKKKAFLDTLFEVAPKNKNTSLKDANLDSEAINSSNEVSIQDGNTKVKEDAIIKENSVTEVK